MGTKTIGLIGGTSWESTKTYYEYLNEITNRELGGMHSAKILLCSLDFAEVISLIEKGEWEKAGEISVRAAHTLETAGADFILLCANTAHKSYDQIQSSIKIPVLHIGEAVADRLSDMQIRKAGLLGTKYTMGEDFYKPYLIRKGIEVLVPQQEDMIKVNSIIYDELCRGIIRNESREVLLRVIEDLCSKGAEGIVLGCTELGLILQDGDAPIPLFDTVRIHSEAAVKRSLH